MAVRPMLLVSLAAIVAAPAAAGAAQVERAQVCGASDCFTFDRHNSGGKLALFAVVGKRAPPPAAPAPWYRLRITFGGRRTSRQTVTSAYVPSSDRIRRRAPGGRYEWVDVIDDLRPVLRHVSDPLEPLPASTLPGRFVSDARADQRGGPLDRPALIAALVSVSGLMFWLTRKRLSGSYLASIRARRS
jgi:hypothetical protein